MVDVDLNMTDIPGLLGEGFGEFTTFIPLDIFLGLIITFLAIGVFLQSDGNLKTTVGMLILCDMFFGVLLFSPFLLGYAVVASMAGAYVMYKSWYGDL